MLHSEDSPKVLASAPNAFGSRLNQTRGDRFATCFQQAVVKGHMSQARCIAKSIALSCTNSGSAWLPPAANVVTLRSSLVLSPIIRASPLACSAVRMLAVLSNTAAAGCGTTVPLRNCTLSVSRARTEVGHDTLDDFWFCHSATGPGVLGQRRLEHNTDGPRWAVRCWRRDCGA